MKKTKKTNKTSTKRLTKRENDERTAFANRENRVREWLEDQTKRAISLRSKDREFHGLEKEFIFQQENMISSYRRAKDAKHPRDIGTAREQILRKFLVETGLLPRRYAISDKSVRVASTTGHISGELDLLFYDPFDSISLMRREEAFEVFPVESTYGTIQVKSNASRQDIRDGLQNIAKYKRLKQSSSAQVRASFGEPRSRSGFGVLFAYDTDLDWVDLVEEVKKFAHDNRKETWCNAVVVLTKGLIFHGDETRIAFSNEAIAALGELQMYGWPDRSGRALYDFYKVLIDLLRLTETQPPPIEKYYRLPLIAGEYSYEFSFGQTAEYETCAVHGDYSRKLSEEQLIKVIEWCKFAKPINWVQATDIASGKPGDNIEAYERQPGVVRIYNPDSLPLADILMRDHLMLFNGKEVNTKSIAFDAIQTSGMTIWIPFYYAKKHGIINSCPKCERKMRQTLDTTSTM